MRRTPEPWRSENLYRKNVLQYLSTITFLLGLIATFLFLIYAEIRG